MAIFVIISDVDRPLLAAAIKARYPDDNFTINGSHWLVSAVATPYSLKEELGVTNGGHGRVMIFAIAGYNGWHDKNMWDWLALKSAQ